MDSIGKLSPETQHKCALIDNSQFPFILNAKVFPVCKSPSIKHSQVTKHHFTHDRCSHKEFPTTLSRNKDLTPNPLFHFQSTTHVTQSPLKHHPVTQFPHAQFLRPIIHSQHTSYEHITYIQSLSQDPTATSTLPHHNKSFLRQCLYNTITPNPTPSKPHPKYHKTNIGV